MDKDRTSFSQERKDQGGYYMIILAIILIVLATIFIYVYRGAVVTEEPTTKDNGTLSKTAILSLIPKETTVSVGQDASLDVVLNTTEGVTGVDVVIFFDTGVLELQKGIEAASFRISEDQTGTLLSLPTTLSIFDGFPYSKLTEKDGKSTYTFSAIKNPPKLFTGVGVVATLTFKALKAGVADITLFNGKGGGNPMDSNVSLLGQDILARVENARITITPK